MKRILPIAMFTLLACTAQAQQAVTYLGAISKEFTLISKDMMSYTSAASHARGAKKIEKRRLELINQIRQAEVNVRKMRPFNNDTGLRDSVVEYFNISRAVMQEDFARIVDMEEVAEQSYDAMEAYLLAKELAGQKMDKAFEKAGRQYEAFAKKNNITLTGGESEVSQKLAAASKVYSYYNKLYLLFFKSYKDETYLLEAIHNGTVSSKEQTKQALLASATEGLAAVGPIPGFKGDVTLKTACQKILSFYKDEAQTKAAMLIDFELKKENFEKVKEAFEAKNPIDRTQEDVNIYNAAVKDYNAAIGKVNAAMGDLDKTRTQLLNNWNKMADQFLDRHVPKYNG